jgi:hypothetical protein
VPQRLCSRDTGGANRQRSGLRLGAAVATGPLTHQGVMRLQVMKGLIYIAGSFETVNRSKCGRGKAWIDNDPHFWTSPPTWGICRNDLRRKAHRGDYIFFVLPKRARHPQMVFGYMRVADKISHDQAFRHRDLVTKRMAQKNPNGNIIVDAKGNYNRFDLGAHKHIFEKVKMEYVVGDHRSSRLLIDREIRALAPNFVETLRRILCRTGTRPIDLITRYGCELSELQVKHLLKWLGSKHHEGVDRRIPG